MEKNEQKHELSQSKLEQLNKQPVIETSIKMSEDKKWFIHKTVITDIKPRNYMDKVMAQNWAIIFIFL